MNRIRSLISVILGALVSNGAAAQSSRPLEPIEVIRQLDEMILAHRAREAMVKFLAPNFIEHDPNVKGGDRQGMLDYLEVEKFDMGRNHRSEMVDVVDRRFASGEYVVTQHHIFRDKNDPGTVICETFHVVDGLIVEHWDVMQAVPAKNAGNPHSMW